MANYADLEIRILDQGPEGYPVEMTLDNEQEFSRGYLDPGFLPWLPAGTAAQDGERLFEWLLADEKLKAAWAEVRGQRPRRRIRLRIDADVPELHAIPWELLRDPGDGVGQAVAAAAATPFSRYLAGRWQPGRPILKRPIKVLAVVSSPDLSQYPRLAPVVVEDEWKLLQEATQGQEIALTLLDPPYSLAAIEAELRKGYHALHFVGHGAFRSRDNQAALYLGDENNQVQLTFEQEIAEMFARLMGETGLEDEDRLRMVFLSSCQTASRSQADAFRGLAPRLIAAGVPAVIAMQDLVSVETAHQFSRTFYGQILQHGLVDLAANEARSSVTSASLPGAAIPVLFSRLQSNVLLGTRGQISSDKGDEFWPYLLDYIEGGHVTAFLGPRITEGLLMDRASASEKLAARYQYPLLDPHNLAQVAQFARDPKVMRKDYLFLLRDSLPGFLDTRPTDEQAARIKSRSTTLSEMIEIMEWSKRVRDVRETEIHHQLAELRLPLYITTNVDSFMVEALRSQGLTPRRLGPRWQQPEAGTPQFVLNPVPSREEPVVFHINGYDSDLDEVREHLVLSEDDYLEQYVRLARDQAFVLPSNLMGILAQHHFLFLGFHLHDWEFRVILQGLIKHIARTDDELKLHVGVQLEVEEHLNAQEAMESLSRYMGARHHIDIYWGSSHQFVNELHQEWREYLKET